MTEETKKKPIYLLLVIEQNQGKIQLSADALSCAYAAAKDVKNSPNPLDWISDIQDYLKDSLAEVMAMEDFVFAGFVVDPSFEPTLKYFIYRHIHYLYQRKYPIYELLGKSLFAIYHIDYVDNKKPPKLKLIKGSGNPPEVKDPLKDEGQTPTKED